MNFTSKSIRQKRIVICGSMSFYAEMMQQKHFLKDAGIDSVLPESDDPFIDSVHEEGFQEVKRRASMRHIRRIRDQKTFGILIVNCDKYGISDYIGPNTFAEIAVAFAHYKRVYLYQSIPDFYRDELVAWQVVCLEGSLSRLIEDCRQAVMQETAQLELFGL